MQPSEPRFVNARIYRPAIRVWPFLLCFMFVLIGIGLSHDLFKRDDKFINDLTIVGSTLFFAALGIIGIVSRLMGLPRLTVGADGVMIQTLFRKKWVRWESIGPFQMWTQSSGRGTRYSWARADIIGKNISANLRGKTSLTIPVSNFAAEPQSLIAELNAQHVVSSPEAVSRALDIEAKKPAFQFTNPGTPLVTYGLILILIAVFGCEYLFSVGAPEKLSPSLPTLLALGGLNRISTINNGEWYRIFTAPLLHGGILHIFFNCLALYYAGIVLERMVGRLWYFVLFSLGAIGGSLMSLMLNSDNMISVGASGAIMGLFAALYTCSYRLPEGNQRTQMQLFSVRVLVPSLIPTFATSVLHIDIGAHLGGAIAGVIGGYLLLKTWDIDKNKPGLRELSVTLSLVAVVLFAVSIGSVVDHYDIYKTLGTMMSEEEVPKTKEDKIAKANELLQRYPQDPRSHLNMAQVHLFDRDIAGAEMELKKALLLMPVAKMFFAPKLEWAIRASLASIMYQQQRVDEAKLVYGPVCAQRPTDQPQKSYHDLLDTHLCDPAVVTGATKTSP